MGVNVLVQGASHGGTPPSGQHVTHVCAASATHWIFPHFLFYGLGCRTTVGRFFQI
jgi:hypothetical protein